MPDLNLDKTVLDDVSPPYVQDTSVSVTLGYANGGVPVDDFIKKWQQANPTTPTQEQLNNTVKILKTCLDANANDINNCPRDVYRLDQVLNMIDLIESDSVTGFGTPLLREKTEAQKIRDRIDERQNTAVDVSELENVLVANGQTGLGTLLVPFLYIRWGTTVLHNSFPSRNIDGNPGQVRNNVQGLTITYDAQSDGSESTGGSGSSTPGTSTCELILNPQLVDANGRKIEVYTDGAELLVMWGYPNASLVRVHTFAQSGIRDSFYNEQTTTVSFRGIQWKTSRLSSQKRFNGGDWRKVVTDIALQACETTGFEEKNCKIVFDPPDFATGEDAFRIGETVQTGRGDIFAHLARVVEKSAACIVSHNNDREGKNDTNRGQYVISISCNPELRQEDANNPRIVDRALWLGQVLAEKIELSDAGDGSAAHANTGGKCGNRRPFRARVKNAILKEFTTGCDYILLKKNDILNKNANFNDEYILELAKRETEGEDTDLVRSVALLAPFTGKVKIDKDGCGSSETTADVTCGPDDRKGAGNSVTIIAEDPTNELLNGFSWTFYYLSGIQVKDGQQVTAGTQIATQGISGTPTEYSTGIRITKEGSTVTRAESQPFINDYIRTITYPCRLAELNEGAACLLPGFSTSPIVGTGSPFHLHLQALDFQNLIVAFDNMASSDTSTCYNLNQAGNVGASGDRKCWDASWERSFKENVAKTCVDAHKNRRGHPCDFYIFAKEGGSRGDNQKRVIANPYPTLDHIYSTDPSFEVGVRFFAEGTNPIPGFYSNGAGEELIAQLFHGDRENLNSTGLANQRIFGCDDDVGFEDTSGNTFLENNDLASLTNGNTKASFANNWQGTRIDNNTKKIFIVAGHRYQNTGATGTGGAFNGVGFSAVYNDEPGGERRNRTLEQIVNIRAMRFFQEYGNARGFSVEVDDGGSTHESFVNALKRAAAKKSEGFYVCELHCDAPISSRGNYGSGSGLIPPLASRGVHVYDDRLAAEFGRYSQGHRNLRAAKEGVPLLEMLSLDGQDFENAFIEDIRSNDFTKSDKFLESLAFRFFSAIANTEVSDVNQSVPAATTNKCGDSGRYPNDAIDRNFKILQDFCRFEKCNPKDIAAFIMAECSWKINNVNRSNGCSGMFQCCPGSAPEERMKNFLSTYEKPQWWPEDSDFGKVATFFKDCTSLRSQTEATFENQLAAWLAYKSAYPENTANTVDVSEGLCLNYTQIAIPNLVPVVREDFNANYKEACEKKNSPAECQKFFNNNATSWFKGKSYSTAEVKGICNYAISSAMDDPRLSGDCTFGDPVAAGSFDSNVDCRNESVNRSLNARNTGTLSSGGLRDLKFRQEIKLNAEFGVCPRNVFLGTSSSDGLPMYILLPNMDNTDGFADFKIRSVSLQWKGSWRWSVTAFRPASQVTFELPPTLRQPRTLNEWTDYYWFPNFQEDGNQFAPSGQKQSFNADGNALNVASTETELRNGVDDEIRNLFNDLQETLDSERDRTQIVISGDNATNLNNQVAAIKTNCAGQNSACLTRFENHLAIFDAPFLRISLPGQEQDSSVAPPGFLEWLDGTILEDIRLAVGRTSQT